MVEDARYKSPTAKHEQTGVRPKKVAPGRAGEKNVRKDDRGVNGRARTFRNDDRGLHGRLEDRLDAAAARKLGRLWEVSRVADERSASIPVNDCMRAAARMSRTHAVGGPREFMHSVSERAATQRVSPDALWYGTVGAVMMTLASYSSSSRWRKTSMCRVPRKPSLHPWPRADEVSRVTSTLRSVRLSCTRR